eukprot:4280866-Pyramimonas_sp.AAC.1
MKVRSRLAPRNLHVKSCQRLQGFKHFQAPIVSRVPLPSCAARPQAARESSLSPFSRFYDSDPVALPFPGGLLSGPSPAGEGSPS